MDSFCWIQGRTRDSQMLKVTSNSVVDPKGTKVSGSNDIVKRQVVTNTHTRHA